MRANRSGAHVQLAHSVLTAKWFKHPHLNYCTPDFYRRARAHVRVAATAVDLVSAVREQEKRHCQRLDLTPRLAMDWEMISEQTLRHIEELLPKGNERGPMPAGDKLTLRRGSFYGAEQQSSSSTCGSATRKVPCR